ncbi:MAG: MMPL family transporter [Kineosporiaceae bacterium]|nr:MMPL family transporter [Kineosporiaceae bacterium]
MTSVHIHPRRSWWIALIMIFIGLGTIGALGEAERTPSITDNRPLGADSTTAAELQATMPRGEGSTAIVLYTADSGRLSGEATQALTQQVIARLGQAPAGPPPLTVSQDGTAAIAVLPVTAATSTENIEVVEKPREDLRAQAPDGVSVQVTGPAAVQADLGKVFDGADVNLLLATATVVAILLLITYRSPTLWLIPLIVVGIADRLAAILATHVLKTFDVAWDESTIGILSVLVFGAGTDYALLLISRYRDELRLTENRYEAMAAAVRRAGEAVLSSAVTVVLGVLTLLLSVIPATRGLGLACAVGIVVAAGYALVVLPCVLVLFGRWVFWPLVPRVGQAQLVDSRSLWRRVGDRVAARPRTFVAATLLLLAGLSVGLGQVRTGLSLADQFLRTPEAITAAERLAESFPAGSSDPAVVMTRSDPDQVIAAVRDLDGVDSVRATAEAGGVTQLDVVTTAAPGSGAAEQAVRDLRTALAAVPETYVGGTEAEALDVAEANSRDRAVIFPLILGLVVGALLILLRSITAAVILVLTVVATYLAALGASWWLFTGIFGFEALDGGAPLITFLFLVALGVDYNIFLVTRAQEEAVRHGSRAGMLRSLTATGGVITSAGILLAAVFAVLGVLPLVVLAQIGVIICVGVLLDTLLVRTVLVPAIAVVLGDRFWWPRKLTSENGSAPLPDSSQAAVGAG